jgi:hypothetical protein
MREGTNTIRVLTYSGRKVCIEIGGRQECFEPLVTGEGTVILSGDHFVWSDKDPQRIAGYKVEARTIAL